jgi:hypothetical protein
MDAGTELFAMAAACAMARSESSQPSAPGDPVRLADHFCRGARRRIARSFREARAGRMHRSGSKIARGVLDGRYEWLEDGVVPLPDGPGGASPQGAPERAEKRPKARRSRASPPGAVAPAPVQAQAEAPATE